VFRFLTGFALGSEWSTGIALVAETWPDRARPKGLGLLQSAFGVGAFIAAAVWYALSLTNPWRGLVAVMFLVGALPAFASCTSGAPSMNPSAGWPPSASAAGRRRAKPGKRRRAQSGKRTSLSMLFRSRRHGAE
jgi:MFS family permease